MKLIIAADVPELTLHISDKQRDDNNRNNNEKDDDYVVLYDDHAPSSSENGCVIDMTSETLTPRVIRFRVFCKWIKLFVLFLFLGGLAFVCVKWLAPFLMDKGIAPIIRWETSTFSVPVLAFILFITVALFPTILLPSSPSMWVAGMTFGYGFGFLLIMPAMIIGVSLPYFVGSLFHHKMEGWLEQYPKRASLIKLAGEGEALDQFRAVALIRISPFPYIIYNYFAVATGVKFGPYILGSILGTVPDILVALYTGILMKTLVDASDKHHTLSAQEIILNVVGFAATVATTIICTILAKRRLRTMPIEDEPLLQ